MVGDILATVNDIAEQSHLLALNAAIEAAAAGEHGRSFSVVAGEIKNLADQSKAATVQVKTILGDIQKEINTSVMLTEEAVKRVDLGKHQADVAASAIRNMAANIDQSVQAFQQIVAGTNQQQIGFENVMQAMKDLSRGSEQAATSTRQTEKAAANLTDDRHATAHGDGGIPALTDIRQKLAAIFQGEHAEHLEHIRSILALLENVAEAKGRSELDEAFRRAHSLKGAARAVDLDAVEGLASGLETLFSRVREGTLPLDQRTTRVIHQVARRERGVRGGVSGKPDSGGTGGGAAGDGGSARNRHRRRSSAPVDFGRRTTGEPRAGRQPPASQPAGNGAAAGRESGPAGAFDGPDSHARVCGRRASPGNSTHWMVRSPKWRRNASGFARPRPRLCGGWRVSRSTPP